MLSAILLNDDQLSSTITSTKFEEIPNVTIEKAFLLHQFSISSIHQLCVDVVFIDLPFVHLNSLDIAEAIQTEFPQITIIFITSADDFIVPLFETLSIDYILNTVTITQLRATIDHLSHKITLKTPQIQLHKDLFFIQTFKQFQLSYDQQPVSFKTVKAKELFAYLIMNEGTPIERNRLLDLFELDANHHQARLTLYATIASIRDLLASLGFPDCIKQIDNHYIFHWHAATIDFKLVEQLLQQIHQIDEQTLPLCEEILALYHGELFVHNHYGWNNLSYQEEILMLLSKMIHYYEALNPLKVLSLLERYFQLDPYDDYKALQYIRTLQSLDRFTDAADFYNDYVQRLHHELSIDPIDELRLALTT